MRCSEFVAGGIVGYEVKSGELGLPFTTPFCNGTISPSVWSSGMHFRISIHLSFLLAESHIHLDQQCFKLTILIITACLVAGRRCCATQLQTTEIEGSSWVRIPHVKLCRQEFLAPTLFCFNASMVFIGPEPMFWPRD